MLIIRLGIQKAWVSVDPWFLLRLFHDFLHPRSMLSSTTLVHNAFFCPAYPRSEVAKFERYMAEYESYLWPFQMLFRFVNLRSVLSSLVSFGGGRVMVIA